MYVCIDICIRGSMYEYNEYEHKGDDMDMCDIHMIAMSKIHGEVFNDSIVCMIHDIYGTCI